MHFDALTILGLMVAIIMAVFIIRTCLTQGCGNSRIHHE